MKIRCWRNLLLFPILALLAACHTVEETGSSGLTLLPEGVLASMSSQAFDSLRREKTVSTDPAAIARVKRVGERVLRAAQETARDLPPLSQWEFVVFEDKEVNAFAMPGGRVAVYTGLLRLAETDEELAVVIGHEIGHIVARHGNQRVSRQILLTGVALGIHQAVKDRSPEMRQAIMVAFGAGSTVGVQLPFSRKDEEEADHLGLIYSARAGYDPRMAVAFWQKMQSRAGHGSGPEYLSTHPSHETRIHRLQALMPKAVAEYEKHRN